MTIKKQSREIYELPDVIYAETIDYGNPRGFKKRVWRPFYEQEAVPHEGIGEYRLVARGTTPVSRTQPPAPVIDSDAGVEHVRFNDGPNERYVDSVTDEELARLKSKSLKNMTDEWDYLLGEISAQKLVLHDGTLDRLNAFIRQRPQPAQDKQEPDAGDAPRISVLKTPEHFPPKVCFSIGVQQFCISPGIGDFTQEDQDNGRLQWYADQLQKAFSNLPHPNPAGEDKNCESAPLLRRFTDNKGNELVEVAAWFYDEMVNSLPDEPPAPDAAKALELFDRAFYGFEDQEYNDGTSADLKEGKVSVYNFWPEDEQTIRATLSKPETTVPDEEPGKINIRGECPTCQRQITFIEYEKDMGRPNLHDPIICYDCETEHQLIDILTQKYKSTPEQTQETGV